MRRCVVVLAGCEGQVNQLIAEKIVWEMVNKTTVVVFTVVVVVVVVVVGTAMTSAHNVKNSRQLRGRYDMIGEVRNMPT